ncbi:hypothetical protein SAMN02745883_00728 [Caminicella sporogenes DSM 14501]|uniref:Uncharacterized protein n=1 Tax=Caminicella sporogenes DSM 14501 TaxID=1121266 RepID=A0A1M6N011_9FIRM|nr:hypothetical protein [Caminicella sporogenes]RKD22423.1 hypothetical protein BET04_05165 [Caminicella sporogenes]SHJ88966.1 hypothetical protein SAMN02745883_00728 [Caminicella sporogenes DSM 14501]
MKNDFSNEVIEYKNKVCVFINAVEEELKLDLDSGDKDMVVEILNMFNENNYLVSEAIRVLEACIKGLKFCPVIRYKR